MEARRGKIGGTRLKDVVTLRGNGRKIGFYELIAERIAVEPDDENPMERGNRLEQEALAFFEDETGKAVEDDLLIWEREDNPGIYVSPDGVIGETEAVEVKCLSSARHIEAWITKEVPKEFNFQTLQYFIVNSKLKMLYLVFYDPRIPAKPFFFLTIKREEVQDDVDKYLEYQQKMLEEVDNYVAELTF